MTVIKQKINELSNKLKRTGFFHVLGSNVINKALVFLNSVVIVRLVSKVDYGIYTYALNIYSFFLLLSGMGLLWGVLQICSEYANNPKKNLEIYKYGVNIGVAVNILLGIVILIVSMFIPLPIKGARIFIMMMAFLPLFQIIVDFKKTYFRTRLDNQKFSYINLINGIMVFIVSIAGAYLYKINGLIIGQYVAIILTIYITGRYLKIFPMLTKSSLKDIDTQDRNSLYKISFISMVNNGFSNLLYLVDIFILGLLIKNSDVLADYKVAIMIPMALVFIPLSVCTYIYSYFSLNRNNKTWLVKHFRMCIISMACINFLITAFLIIFAPIIIKILFGSKYLSSVGIFRISSIGYFFIGTFRIIAGNLLVTQRKLTFNLVVSIVAAILNIILNYILITRLGAKGAAISTLIVAMITGFISTYYFIHVIRKIPSLNKE